MTAYYNENDPFAAALLRNLISEGLIADGHVDERSISDVRPVDLRGYIQCHFFAGIGGWSYALRLAAWPDHRPVWTGSCPCQPFSLAGKQGGFADERHLWPHWRYLIRQCKPAKILGEQVASASDWLRLVRGDLEAMGYAVGALPIQAASAGADHLRDRYWFVADAAGERRNGSEDTSGASGRHVVESRGCDVGVSDCAGRAPGQQAASSTRHGSAAVATGGDLEWVIGADGKARRVKSGIRLLAHGVPNRVGLLRGFGNAIDPRCAAAFILACS